MPYETAHVVSANGQRCAVMDSLPATGAYVAEQSRIDSIMVEFGARISQTGMQVDELAKQLNPVLVTETPVACSPPKDCVRPATCPLGDSIEQLNFQVIRLNERLADLRNRLAI